MEYENTIKTAETILANMTLEEKVRQMQMLKSSMSIIENGKFSPQKADEVFQGMSMGCVQVFDLRDLLSPEAIRQVVIDLQAYLRERTKNGIPALIVAESLHGIVAPGTTSFPQSIGMGCTWNTELVEKMAEGIAEEAEAFGVSQVLAPDLDLARDPRWGRVEETYGEDPYLVGELGAAYIRGMQKKGGITTTLKHFAAHGTPEGGVNLSPVNTGERQVRELYLPPFERAMKENPLSVMPAYSEIDGKPCSSSKKLLTGILRDEMGFEGYTISDYMAVEMLHNFHLTAADPADAGRQALIAGMDLEAPYTYGFGGHLIDMVKDGRICEADIDRAVRRILYVKLKLGLFDAPSKVYNVSFRSDKNMKLALEAAEESVVLLKNNRILPLSKEIESVAVIGPNIDVAQLGDYCYVRDGVTLLEGVKRVFSGKINACNGSGIYRRHPEALQKAVEMAEKSDVVILALGGSSMANGGVGWGEEGDEEVTCGEGFDSADIRLPAVQMELAERIFKTGRPVVLVMEDGRPCAIPEIYDRADAVLYAWYPGIQGGMALANVIFGLTNPSGKLCISIPKHVGQIPVCYNHKPSARGFYHQPGTLEEPGRDYVFMDTRPYYPFGYGLSYTSFCYRDLRIEAVDGYDVTISVEVENIGKRAGKEVVQLYLRDEVSSVTTPVKALKGFEKIELEPGERKKVTFQLGFDELSLINEHMKRVVEPGTFRVMVDTLCESFIISK